jgi:hypothetical protein
MMSWADERRQGSKTGLRQASEENMNVSALQDIEARIGQLTTAEKQLLLERLAGAVRAARNAERRAALTAMAADPDIQREIQEIGQEFAETAEDGLENL